MTGLLETITGLAGAWQWLIGGLCVVGLWVGAEKVIAGARDIARRFGVSELIIGLTVVSIGSSFPEIFVNINAGLKGVDDVGVGNIVGSCFVQISMILGLCVLVGGAMSETRKSIVRDGGMLLLSILLMFVFGMNGEISTIEALVMIFIYAAYMAYLWHHHEKNAPEKITKKAQKSVTTAMLYLIIGTGLVWISSDILIYIGIHAGEKMGISDSIIGLLSGIGTSIPELSVSMIALLKHSNGISVGNLLGSNITDPLLSLPIGALLARGYSVDPFLTYSAIPAWFVASSVVLLIFYFRGRLGRVSASLLIMFYIGSFLVFLS